MAEGNGRFRRLALRLLAIVLLAGTAHLVIGWTESLAQSGRSGTGRAVLVLLLAGYALLIAIPFVPGVEVGLSLLAMHGAGLAPSIYLATVGGLLVAYGAGALLPEARLASLLSDLGLVRAAAAIDRFRLLDRAARVAVLQDRAPRLLRTVLMRYRYLWLAGLVNLPGNALIGGGGGILFVAGLSRLFRPVPVALTLALSVLPVPLAVWLWDLRLPV